nr:PD-(D/E)XK motif protein [Loktanella sp. M215]
MPTWTELDLARIWKALSGLDENLQWRVSVLANLPEARLLAGRAAPGNREGILIRVHSDLLPPTLKLPKGTGFDMLRISEWQLEGGAPMLALVRAPGGASDLFTMMAVDVLRHVEMHAHGRAPELLDAFLSRVTDWQVFMSADRSKPLSPEKQAGLQGELCFLETLLNGTGDAQMALGMWQGPFRAAQDFHVAVGAVEVKATASTRTFRAKINSIEQLDSDREPLFLVAVRFSEDPKGEALRDLVARLKIRMLDSGAAQRFQAILFACRYFAEHEASYDRPLAIAEQSCFLVEENFPCLRRDSLPPQIMAASYDLDLATIETACRTEAEMLRTLGVN